MTTFDSAPARARLQRVMDDDASGLPDRLGVDRQTIRTVFRRTRLRTDTADRIAIALGCHPCELWPDWFAR